MATHRRPLRQQRNNTSQKRPPKPGGLFYCLALPQFTLP
ncbi:coiled-coil domain-containing protein 13-like [Acetobacter orientalis]|uniref:Coiled-coil domain-containing protein 13-like n=1 Tax=Acetobacter orientalis TaxID=146474 RepID=A0A2Z5ZFN5_9PROT|nr:coiled-coil domain-containing protein 13-like [Acetobacter orientalis]